MKTLKRLIPILDWLPNYKSDWLRGDIIAGITVAIVLIPQGIAYALIAGMPPIYGLYCALVPQIMYAIFGSSRQVAVGPVAMDSLIVATGVSTLALVGSESYIEIAILLAFVVGIIQLLMGVLQLGFIVNFLSKPVINGFTSAVALIIGLNQLKNLFGVELIQTDQIQYLIKDIWENILDFHGPTTLIGLIASVIIILSRKVSKKIPNALIVVVLGILSIRYFNTYFDEVEIVKEIPSGLPSFHLPAIDFDQIRELLPIAFTLVFVGYLETISIGKSLEAKQDDYRIRPNQELIAIGFSNLVGSLFKAYPSASSFSRSAINYEVGGKTGMSSLVSVVIVIVTITYLTPLFFHLPNAVLAAIIIVAVFGLINIKEAIYLWRADRMDFWLLIATFVSTLLLGIEYGIVIGVGLSLIVLIYRTTRPYIVELGKVPDSNFYRNKDRFSDVILEKEILVFRFDAQLFYANASYFRDELEKLTNAKGDNLKLIVLDGESINRVDSTGVEMLKERIKYYQKRKVLFYLAGIKGPVRDQLFKAKILDLIDIGHFFMRVNGAVKFFKTGNRENQKKYEYYIYQSSEYLNKEK